VWTQTPDASLRQPLRATPAPNKGANVKLYHFTACGNLESICEQGLVPAIGKSSAPEITLTLGLPVVWLTSKPAPTWMAGLPEDLCILTLDVKRGKRLHHWRTWLGSAECDAFDEHGKPLRIVGKEVLAGIDAYMKPTPLAPSPAAATQDYFIYTGTIHHRRIIQVQRVEYRRRNITLLTAGYHPTVLYHVTHKKFLPRIRRQGLKCMFRVRFGASAILR
jgi:hypothetical protein